MTIECYLSNCPYHDAMLGLDPGPFCGKSECDGLRAMHKEIGRLKEVVEGVISSWDAWQIPPRITKVLRAAIERQEKGD